MKVSTLKDAVLLARAAGVTPFVWGHRGVGKSSLHRQICESQEMGFIDMRCSQMEASDIRGLPDRVNGRTAFLPPSDMPTGSRRGVKTLLEDIGMKTDIPLYDAKGEKVVGKIDLDKFDPLNYDEFLAIMKAAPESSRYLLSPKLQAHLDKGILFLDEVNRAQDDVIQAVFQLVLDRQIGQYVLPPGWSVACAGNYMEGYQVNGFTDPAFLSRFCHLIFSDGETTVEEWVAFMANTHGEKASGVIEYATQNTKHLDGDVKGDLGFSIGPNRRSWEMVVKVETAFTKGRFNDDAKHEAICGLVGFDMANAYRRYSCPVKPREILEHGTKNLHAKLNSLSRGQMMGLTWGLVSLLKAKVEEDKYGDCALDWARFTAKYQKDKDLSVAFCTAMISGSGMNKTRFAMISNPKVAQLIGKFVGGGKKSFIHRLNEDPELQNLLSRTAWGSDAEEK